jgi:hypothetical protein
LTWFEFESGTILMVLPLSLFRLDSFRESCLLVLWYAGSRCGMMGNDEDRGRSRRPGA